MSDCDYVTKFQKSCALRLKIQRQGHLEPREWLDLIFYQLDLEDNLPYPDAKDTLENAEKYIKQLSNSLHRLVIDARLKLEEQREMEIPDNE